MRTYIAYGMRVIEWLGQRDTVQLKVEAPLGLVVLSKGLSDFAGRRVTAVHVTPDNYAGQPPVIWDGSRLVELLPGETEEAYRANVLKERAAEEAAYADEIEATIECGDQRDTFTFKNQDEANGFWRLFRWAKEHEIDGHELNELSPED